MRLFLLVLLIVFQGCASGGKMTKSGFNISLHPDKDDLDALDVFVDGQIESRNYTFILDTGAGLTNLKSDKYLQKLKVVGEKSSAGAFAKQKEYTIEIPILRVGSLTQTNVQATRAETNLQTRRNLLGMNFLKNYALHFKYDEGRVEVVERGPNVNDLFLDEGAHPYVDIKWAKIRASGVWDTGAGITLFDLNFIKKHSDLFKKVGSSTGTDSTGAQMETPVYEVKNFELGGQQFPAIKVVAIDLALTNSTIKRPMDFVIGNNVIKKAHWIFDFPAHKWAITKMLP